MNSNVSIMVKNSIATITISNPPVNALGRSVRKGLLNAIDLADKDLSVRVIVIRGAGKTFPVGADINEFALLPMPPNLSEVCERIENSVIPIVIAIHGYAFGGGLEIALAGHYRISTMDAVIALPEVHLGLLPGAGGTQRLPRLVGVGNALDIILTGRHISSKKALELGIIDKLCLSLEEDARLFAENLIEQGAAVKKTKNKIKNVQPNSQNRETILNVRNKLKSENQRLTALYKIVDCIEASFELTFNNGLSFESKAFQELRGSDQSKSMIHSFFSERRALKVPEKISERSKDLKRIGVIGGGTMGSGISIAAIKANLEVLLIERDKQTLLGALRKVTESLERDVEKGRSTQNQCRKLRERISGSIDYSELAGVDLVIEAVTEDLQIKKNIFKLLDNVLPPGIIMASNTSYLNIDDIAAATSRPQDIIGLHFFSPANIMKLLEIVVTKKASDNAVATGFELAKIMRKKAVRAKNSDGFIGNRILRSYNKVASYIMEDGASPYQIDLAVREFGYPIGPFQMSDMAGGDIGWSYRKRIGINRKINERYVEIPDRICERGWFGQKTGRGYYIYKTGSRAGLENPGVEEIIKNERKKKSILERRFSNEEIVDRYLAAMVNESANVVYEGIALRPSDVDVIKLNGFGFPRYRGGPMHYADTYGLSKMLDNIERFGKEDANFWKPSPLLIQLVNTNNSFESLNK